MAVLYKGRHACALCTSLSLGFLQSHWDKLPILVQFLVSFALHEWWCWSSGLGSSANKGDSCDLWVSGKIFFQFSKIGCFSVWEKEKNSLFWMSESKSSALASMLWHFKSWTSEGALHEFKHWSGFWACVFLLYSLLMRRIKITWGKHCSQLQVSAWNCFLFVDLIFISTTLNLKSGCLIPEVSREIFEYLSWGMELSEINVPETARDSTDICFIYRNLDMWPLCNRLFTNRLYRCLKW